MIVTPRRGRNSRASRNAAHELRHELIDRGVDPDRVAATPDSRLNRLDRMTQPLQLVDDLEDDAYVIDSARYSLADAYTPFDEYTGGDAA